MTCVPSSRSPADFEALVETMEAMRLHVSATWSVWPPNRKAPTQIITRVFPACVSAYVRTCQALRMLQYYTGIRRHDKVAPEQRKLNCASCAALVLMRSSLASRNRRPKRVCTASTKVSVSPSRPVWKSRLKESKPQSSRDYHRTSSACPC